MSAMLLPMPGNAEITASLATPLQAEVAALETRRFPDGESYLRIGTALTDRSVAIVCTLDRPDMKFLPLIFAANTARELGAGKVGLIAPYLAYMRQDRSFHPGEAVTSRSFAHLLSANFDWLVTIDPHLHRYKSLSDIYTIPTRVLHAASLLSDWIGRNVTNPILIGPDRESTQWVSEAAARIGAPFTVLDKIRKGDRDVQISMVDGSAIKDHVPVLVDDIIASGATMLQAIRLLHRSVKTAPICVAVHGLFAEGADTSLAREGARLITTNSVPHATNAIDVAGLLVDGARDFLGGD